MVQRARAYGYRAEYLPFCKIYASQDALDALLAGVETELDARARLRERMEAGEPINTWASDVGFVLSPGLQPTRRQVVMSIADVRSGWHVQSRPSTDPDVTESNREHVQTCCLLDAPRISYGRL